MKPLESRIKPDNLLKRRRSYTAQMNRRCKPPVTTATPAG
jgi:hypothetical protein